MSTLSDARFTALRGLGFTGSANDMLLQYWQDGGATSPSMNDAKLEWLVVKGFTTGAVNDRWFAYLTGAVATPGTISDMELQFWADLGPAAALIANGNFSSASTTGWVITGGANSFISAGGVGTMDSSSTGYASYAFTTIIGVDYTFQATIKDGSLASGGFMAIRKADDTDASVNVVNVVQGSSPQSPDISNTIVIAATATTTYLVIQGNNVANIIVDDLSVVLT